MRSKWYNVIAKTILFVEMNENSLRLQFLVVKQIGTFDVKTAYNTLLF